VLPGVCGGGGGTYSVMYNVGRVERIAEAGVVAGEGRNICFNARAVARRLVGRACLLRARAIVFKIRSDAAKVELGNSCQLPFCAPGNCSFRSSLRALAGCPRARPRASTAGGDEGEAGVACCMSRVVTTTASSPSGGLVSDITGRQTRHASDMRLQAAPAQPRSTGSVCCHCQPPLLESTWRCYTASAQVRCAAWLGTGDQASGRALHLLAVQTHLPTTYY
jgi:hypothetical protein